MSLTRETLDTNMSFTMSKLFINKLLTDQKKQFGEQFCELTIDNLTFNQKR